MRARLLSDEQGYMITSTVLTISAILAILLAGMTGLAVASFQIAAYNNARTEALYVAESGINYALWNLNTSGAFTPSLDYVDIESGHSRYKVEEYTPTETEATIKVRGEVKTGYGSGWTHRTIEVTAEKSSGLGIKAPQGIIGLFGITNAKGSLVDSYNSNTGAYGSNGDVFTNGPLAVTDLSVIKGDVIAGVNPGKNVTVASGSKVTGTLKTNNKLDILVASQKPELGEVEVGGDVTINTASKITSELKTKGKLIINKFSTIGGNVKTIKDVTLDDGSQVTSNLKTNGKLVIEDASKVSGNVEAIGNVQLTNFSGIEGNLATNGNVTMTTASYVTGDLTCGGSLTKDLSSRVDGTVTEGESTVIPLIADSLFPPLEEISLDPIPEFETGTTDITVTSFEKMTLDVGKYRDITVNTGGELTLKAGDYYIRSLTVETGGELIADNDGPSQPIKVFISGNTDISIASLVNNSGKPPRFLVFSQGKNITVSIAAGLKGVIYAPDAEIKIMNAGEIYGALAGESIDNSVASKIHYDEAVGEMNGGYLIPPGGDWQLKSWKEM